MNFLLWNVRGASRANFFSSLKTIITVNKAEVCVVMELRVSGSKALGVAKKVGFNNVHFEEARGFSGVFGFSDQIQ